MVSVCIIIPAYNASRFIRQTLESALAQDLPSVEVLLVDDGSCDDTVAIAAGYVGVRVVIRRNGGDAAARNTGFHQTSSDFIIFLDHDDVLLPGAVRTHLAAFEPGIDMVFGSNDLIDAEGAYVGSNPQVPQRFSGCDVALGTTPSFSQCMYRRAAVSRIGGLRSGAGSAADHDLNLRLLGREERGLCHAELVMSYRLHADQQTKSPARLYRAQMAVIEEHLGVGGFMSDPALLVRARRHWARYFGQFMLQEIVRAAQSGRWRVALRAAATYIGGAPHTVVGTGRYLLKRSG